jgi:hypothetical protein
MPYRLTVNQDNLPEGAEVSITGLGVFKNGSTTEVSDNQAEFFRVMNSRILDTRDKDGNILVGNFERVPGSALEDANIFGVTVEKVEGSNKEEQPVDGNVPAQPQEIEDARKVNLEQDVVPQRDPNQMSPEEVAESDPVVRDTEGVPEVTTDTEGEVE